jgi:hypothetical protein
MFCRGEKEEWTTQFYSGTGATLDLPQIGCTLAMSAIYERVFAAP